MTVLEQRTMESVCSINRKMRDQHDIDWEQRRYEIARDILPYCCETSKEILLAGGKLDGEGKTMAEKVAHQSVMFADALIERLKRKEV